MLNALTVQICKLMCMCISKVTFFYWDEFNMAAPLRNVKHVEDVRIFFSSNDTVYIKSLEKFC